MSTNEIAADGLETELTADDVLADVRSTARAMVRGGCCTFEQVLGRALEIAALADDAPAAGSVERVVRLEWDARAAVLAGRREGSSDHLRVERAFAALEREGVAARLGLACCQECGERELRREVPDGGAYAVVTRPDLEQVPAGRLVVRCGVLAPDVDVEVADATTTSREAGDVPARVAAALAAQGLDARASGNSVVVHVRDWRKPLPAVA
jgi:hypothetical protein